MAKAHGINHAVKRKAKEAPWQEARAARSRGSPFLSPPLSLTPNKRSRISDARVRAMNERKAGHRCCQVLSNHSSPPCRHSFVELKIVPVTASSGWSSGVTQAASGVCRSTQPSPGGSCRGSKSCRMAETPRAPQKRDLQCTVSLPT